MIYSFCVSLRKICTSKFKSFTFIILEIDTCAQMDRDVVIIYLYMRYVIKDASCSLLPTFNTGNFHNIVQFGIMFNCLIEK